MTTLIKLGNSKEHGNNISLSDFSWDCNWYWAGGYLGNRQCHFHLESYFKKDINAYDAIKKDFGESLNMTDDQLWRFLDLFKQFYSHTKSAECFQYGGHFTSKNRKEDEINKELAKTINDHIENVIIREIRALCVEIKNTKEEKINA